MEAFEDNCEIQRWCKARSICDADNQLDGVDMEDFKMQFVGKNLRDNCYRA